MAHTVPPTPRTVPAEALNVRAPGQVVQVVGGVVNRVVERLEGGAAHQRLRPLQGAEEEEEAAARPIIGATRATPTATSLSGN